MSVSLATETDALPVRNVPDLTMRLAAPRKEIEHNFIQMGDKLIASTRLLNETSEAYSQMAGALAGAEFTNLTESLRGLSSHISNVDRSRAATKDFLTALNSLTDQFPDCIHLLTRAVRTLRMFFITARVTASLSGKKENSLQQLTDQFSELGTQLDGNVSYFIDAFKSMRSSLSAATNMNEKLGAQHAKLLDGIAAEQKNNIETMESRRVWAEKRIAIHGDTSAKINAGISRAVGTLQVGDSTRQRVEHVEEALNTLHNNDDEATVLLAFNLMAVQIDGAIKDFDGEAAALVRSFEELIGDTESLLERASEDSEMLLLSGDAALGIIDNSIQRTARMLEQYERGNAARSVAIDQLVTAVSKMLDHIGAFDNIRSSVRLLSLNSTLKATTLDEDGRAFRQVASDLRELSDETNKPVENMVENLEQSATLLREFLESRNAGNGERIAEMRETVNQASQCVAHIAGQLRRQAESMAKTGPEALTQLNVAAATVRDRQDFCAAWRVIASELSGPSYANAQSGSDVDDSVISGIYTRYTMKAERDIHKAFFGLDIETDDQPSDDLDDTAGAELDDIFF
jgi:hypothetical protein